MRLNGIVWSFYYAEAEDLIWAVPDIESRWCIGAYARDMAVWGVSMDAAAMDHLSENDYIYAAAEGMSEGLSRYYPRQGFSMPLQEEEIWPSILAENNADYGMEFLSNQTTAGIFSLDGAVFEINSYREDLRFWWMHGSADSASMAIYSIPEGGDEDWIILADIRRTPFDTDIEGYRCYRTVQLPGNENLYLGINALLLSDQTLEEIVDELQSLLEFDYCGKEESWHTVNIGRTLQTQQGYDWSGLAMVYEDYEFKYVHDADAFDVHQQDYVNQQTINGIRWTFRFHKDNDVMYAYPESEPELCIGADPGKMYQWSESQYGDQVDYFEAIVSAMRVGLRNYYLRPGVELEPEPEPENDPITYTPDQSNTIRISLGNRGYYLKPDLEDAWLTWYFTREHDGVVAADMSVGAGCGAQVYISEMPVAMYEHRSHGQIPVDDGGTLYWYCIELYDGNEAQPADLMNGLTASDALYSQWGGVVIDDTLYSRQSLEWSGWENVAADGSRTMMMWNLVRPSSLELGDPVAQQKINGIVWTLYITPEYSSEQWPFIWAVPDVNPNLAIGSDYENAVYRYYEVNGMTGGFNGELWSAESINGAVEMMIEVLGNYYPDQKTVCTCG